VFGWPDLNTRESCEQGAYVEGPWLPESRKARGTRAVFIFERLKKLRILFVKIVYLLIVND
jgi:hypothetical protein